MGIKSSREDPALAALPPLPAQLRAVWARPLPDLPVAKDLPRLVRKIGVWSGGEGRYAACPEPRPLQDELLALLAALAAPQPRPLPLDDPEALTGVLAASPPRTQAILRACTQSIVAPAVTRLKQLLAAHLRFKDVQGGWRIEIHLGAEGVRVVHRRREQVVIREGARLEDSFQFEWELALDMDPDATTITHIGIALTGVDFEGIEAPLSDKERERAEKMLRKTIMAALRGG